MSASVILDPGNAALFGAAHTHSPADEQRCHVLIDLLDTCHAVSRALRRELARNHLTETGFRVLAMAVQREPLAMMPSDVASALGLPRPAVSSILGRLEVSGLITRERTSDDRRIFAIRATQFGRRSFSIAVNHYRVLVTRLMSSLDPESITALDQACRRLRQFSAPVKS